MTPPFLRSPLLENARAPHGFFGRAGGVSSGLFATLNTGLGTRDDIEAVRENRARCAGALGVARLVTLHQIHSSDVVTVRAPWPDEARPRGDGMVADRPGVALGVLAADCMPVLFCDPAAGVIGAAHAGWRGALAGVIEATLAAMTRIGAQPARVVAAIGPCLRQPNFEVGLEVVDAFKRKHPLSERFFGPGVSPEKRQLDLASFGAWRLRESGVAGIDDVEVCTLAAPLDYFSYRASRRAGEPDYGRNLSAIACPAP
ncbi:MAG: peptidoglycan editing factor PgeF [Parvularculaceae bacterium]|nr:peptidoglycan editing factor PgeF [Parvularculaceae bacterium]